MIFFTDVKFWIDLQQLVRLHKVDRVEMRATEHDSLTVGLLKDGDLILYFSDSESLHDGGVLELGHSSFLIDQFLEIDFNVCDYIEADFNDDHCQLYFYNIDDDVVCSPVLGRAICAYELKDLDLDYSGCFDLSNKLKKFIRLSAGAFISFNNGNLVSNTENWFALVELQCNFTGNYAISKKDFTNLPPGKYTIALDDNQCHFCNDQTSIMYVFDRVPAHDYIGVQSVSDWTGFRQLKQLAAVPKKFPLYYLVGAVCYYHDLIVRIVLSVDDVAKASFIYRLDPTATIASREKAKTFNGVSID